MRTSDNEVVWKREGKQRICSMRQIRAWTPFFDSTFLVCSPTLESQSAGVSLQPTQVLLVAVHPAAVHAILHRFVSSVNLLEVHPCPNINEDQVFQAWFPLCKSLLTTNYLPALHVFGKVSRFSWSTTFLGKKVRLTRL